jgi:hypothetical protein
VIIIYKEILKQFIHFHRTLAAASHKVYQLLAYGRWFSPGTPASSTTKTGRHDIAEILLKVALNTKINQSIILRINDVDYLLVLLMLFSWHVGGTSQAYSL